MFQDGEIILPCSGKETDPVMNVIRMLDALPAYDQWKAQPLPREIRRWVNRADAQQVMSLVAAGLSRLATTKQEGKAKSKVRSQA